MGKENTYRRIPQVPGQLDKSTLNELYRQFSEMIYAGEGRRGPIEKKDSLNITADDRHSPLRFSGKGNRGAGAISFGGVNNASMFIAKGAYMNDQGSWVAEDGTAVIQEMNRDSLTPLMYRNEGLQIGQIFTPTQVGGVVVGPTPPSGGGGGVVVGPLPDMGLDDLNDVTITGVLNGQVLVWDAGTSQWVNQTLGVPDHGTLSGRSAADQHPASAITGFIPSRGGTLFNPSGITASANVIVWYAPYACEVTNVRGYRVGGTSATINARRNGTDNHLAAALSVSSTNTWMDGGAVQNIAYVAGDKLEIMLVTVAGSPTQIAIQVDFRRI